MSLASKFDTQTELLARELEEILTPLSNVSDLYSLIKEPLNVQGRIAPLTNSQKPWPILPLAVAESICGEYEQAVPAALALQLLMVAGDVFDDIEDCDTPDSISSKNGPAIATNIGTTLLILAEKALTRLKTKGINDAITLQVIEKVNSYFTKSCVGQHLDLSSSLLNLSEDKYLEMVALKSASQIECACYAGAALSTTEEQIITMFSVFGHNLGMAAQISNDIMGIVTERDIAKRKITLPVIFALNHSDDVSKSIATKAYNPMIANEIHADQIKTILFNSGAVQYSSLQMTLYQEYAKEALTDIQKLGISVASLGYFLN